VDLERSTLADWMGATSALLGPLVEALRHYAGLEAQCDDTPVPVVTPGTGKTKTGRFDVRAGRSPGRGHCADDSVWFVYSPDFKGPRLAGRTSCSPGLIIAGSVPRPLIGSAKLNRLDLEAYLPEVLSRIATTRSTNR